jgi:MFS family permease
MTSSGGCSAADAMPAPCAAVPAASLLRALLPSMVVVLAVFLAVGLAVPVLPLHVHRDLGLGPFVVGLVAGSQFAASFVSRPSAGHYADSRGAKRAIVLGLLMATGAGLLYLLSLRFMQAPVASVAVLLTGRALLGGAESFVMTGALSLGLALAGPQNTGTVIAWVGTAMFAAFALGAALGTALYAGYGMAAIALATALVAIATLLVVLPLKPVPPTLRARAAFGRVVGAVWLPGLGMAFSSIGFGVMLTFVTLLFAERGWQPAWPALTLFSFGFILMRAFFGHLPDRVGAARVVLASVVVETLGLALLGLAAAPPLALLGATLTRPLMANNTTHRPATIQRIRIGAGRDGRITAIAHESLSGDLPDGQPETAVSQTELLYAGANRLTAMRLAVLDLPEGNAMRAPGEAPGLMALEVAMDEMAEKLGMDPVEFRIVNDTQVDPEHPDRPFSQRQLIQCLRQGAERFGWSRRNATPGQRREGRWLVGMGMAAGFRNNLVMKSGARVRLDGSGGVAVETDMTDIGTGSYTFITQTAAEMMGVPIEKVTVRLGDSSFPVSAGSGGQ